jgi:hypothetical protein
MQGCYAENRTCEVEERSGSKGARAVAAYSTEVLKPEFELKL